jgi:hypothetical protein
MIATRFWGKNIEGIRFSSRHGLLPFRQVSLTAGRRIFWHRCAAETLV